MARRFKVGQSVRIMTSARTDAIGTIRSLHGDLYAVVRLPNWQADGVHKDTTVRVDELETGHGRAKVCRCPYCPGYFRR